MKTKRFLALLLCMAMIFGILPTMTITADTDDAVKTEYVKVNSVDEIVPNARYIIIGTYTDDEGNVTYHAMGKENRPYDGFRCSYGQDQYGVHNFDISEDTSKITVYTYPTYDPILRLRITPRDDEGRFYLGVDGKGYLCGFSNSTSDGAIGHDLHSCMPISNYTIGEIWWYMRVIESGDYAGDWQIVNRSRLGNYRGYDYDVIRMGRPYPNSAGQFRAEQAFTVDVGVIPEDEQIKHTVDYDTNIWLYREVCKHDASEVTHAEAVSASCAHPGNIEYWYCAGCETYSASADFSEVIRVADVFIPATAHTESCGHTGETVKFEPYIESSMGSNQSGERYLLIGEADGKYYAMGNITNPDGSRNAVEVVLGENGIITANSHEAEFITFDYDGMFGYLVDGGYFSAIDGKIIVYDKTLYGMNKYIPRPVSFMLDSWDTGAGSFYAYSSRDLANEYINFDAENLCFRAQSTSLDNTYRYRELCPHTKYHQPAIKATCTRCGNVEYWYCDTCYKYFGAEDGSVTLDENFIKIHATGHDYTENGCENCGQSVPVYSKVTSKDQLGQPGTYIIVATDGTNTYVLKEPFNMWLDLDGNGIPDFEEIDENENEIPDAYEKDSDGDGEPDIWDYDYIEPSAIPVTVNADGTISVLGLGAAEFEMIESEFGYEPMPSSEDLDVPPETPSKQYYFWMPNGLLNGLNEVNTRFACFVKGEQIDGADETSSWGISFGDSLTAWEVLDLLYAKFNVDNDHAVMYAENCGNGATRPLRLRIYDGKAYFVTEYDAWLPGATEMLDEDGNVVTDTYGNPLYDTHDEQYGVYLYYAAGVGGGEDPNPGDMNGDETLNSADAIYLLRHVIMPDLYPIEKEADMNGDGVINSADAIYLLRHVIMPDLYPLS